MTRLKSLLRPPRALALLMALALGSVAARAPVLSPDYQAHVGWAEAARVSLDPKAYTLLRARQALAKGDGAAAADWARRSLSGAPQNAYAWLTLAWAEAVRGDDAAAQRALERSYEYAPRSMALAQGRVALAQRWWPQMDLAARQRLLAEVRVARGVDPALFNRRAAEIPRLAALHRLARP